MHTWTEQELWVVCVCYKENLPIDLALKLTNTTNEKSMYMRYQNCLFLDKGRVKNSLSHTSKTHVKVWEKIQELYSTLPPQKQEEPEPIYCDFAIGALFMAFLMNLFIISITT